MTFKGALTFRYAWLCVNVALKGRVLFSKVLRLNNPVLVDVSELSTRISIFFEIWIFFHLPRRFKEIYYTYYFNKKYVFYITITNENRLEAKVNIVRYQTNITSSCSLSSTSTGLSLKYFEKRTHPIALSNFRALTLRCVFYYV